MEARRARKVGLVTSSRRSNAARKVGSCGMGTRGWIYVKKSSMSSRTVSNGHIDSADAGEEVLDEKLPVDPGGIADAISEADGLGECAGDPAADAPDVAAAPSFCFFMASAWRFGGPRRRLGRSYVQGISRLAQDRQGGPLVSHYIVQSVFSIR